MYFSYFFGGQHHLLIAMINVPTSRNEFTGQRALFESGDFDSKPGRDFKVVTLIECHWNPSTEFQSVDFHQNPGFWSSDFHKNPRVLNRCLGFKSRSSKATSLIQSANVNQKTCKASTLIITRTLKAPTLKSTKC